MSRLSIRHETRYEYERPVSFGQHRLLVRPRDGHSLRLLEASLELSPPGATRWTYDALGNCVCWYQPAGQARVLKIVSQLTLERYPAPLIPIDNPHSTFPVTYEPSDRLVLTPFTLPASEDQHQVLLTEVRSLVGQPAEPVLDYIQRMNRAIYQKLIYGERYEEGVQPPAVTLGARQGTCRDFAWLMVEGLRTLGIAARFVTGYLYDPMQGHGSVRGGSSTHAWCEAFLPGLGWTQFDPTNGLAESAELIPVAISRRPPEAAPVSGTLIGDPGARHLHVDVDVRLIEPNEASATAA